MTPLHPEISTRWDRIPRGEAPGMRLYVAVRVFDPAGGPLADEANYHRDWTWEELDRLRQFTELPNVELVAERLLLWERTQVLTALAYGLGQAQPPPLTELVLRLQARGGAR